MIGKWITPAARAVRNESAPVTYGLIAVCCAIFLIGPAAGLNPGYGTGDELLAAQRAYFHRWGVVPVELFGGTPRAALTPLTALFVHGSWLHLLGNMLFLFVFGAMAEERMGRVAFALFYVICGYLALVAYAAAHAGSPQSLVGASGAISAVLGAFLFLFPRARVTSLLP
ncbi:MAG TPA: rhomboid family intramembrane serine protease, partial [Streptomyces sp.]|nr:rhomboid family intramembrane serine protease [Streptomyces sp.]